METGAARTAGAAQRVARRSWVSCMVAVWFGGLREDVERVRFVERLLSW